ncbi:MAG: hypothetical protein IT204_02420 [Fimbriimonadaceae bacterium]|nr:hypothetical protein [Fimbriimonadaceae bacterium]
MSSSDAPAQRRPFNLRVCAWFAFWMTVIVVWTENSTLVVNSTSFNSLAPSIALVFVLAVFTGAVNPLLRRLRPGWALDGREQILLYIMLSIGSPLSSIGLVHFLYSVVEAPFYHARPENKWDLFTSAYPNWFAIPDAIEARHFWEGSADGVPWRLWRTPLAMWSIFVLAFNFGLLSCVLLVHQQWIRSERLTFPLVYLPLELTAVEQGQAYSPIWRNQILWIGFSIAIVPHLFNGLHTYFPAVPLLPFKNELNLTRGMTEPWRQLGSMPLNFYPCIIAFAALLPLDVSLSVWFFFVVQCLLSLFGGITGLTAATSGGATAFPFAPEQSVGAWLGLVLVNLWFARHHLRAVLLGTGDAPATAEDIRLHRTALLAFACCLAVLVTWSCTAGMSPLVATVFFGLVFMLCLALARIRGEAGVGCISGPMMPQDLLLLTTGTRAYTLRDLTVMTTYRWFTVEFRGAPTVMGYQLEALKMADSVGASVRHVVAAVGVATVFTMVVASYVTLGVIYKHGGITLNTWRFSQVPTEGYNMLVSWIQTPRERDWLRIQAVLFGAAVLFGLTSLRMKVLWWPLHPIGYAVGFTKRTIPWIWFAFLLGWLLKAVVLKVGGHRWHQKLPVFCLGLILGDFFMAGLFGVVGALVPQAGYQAFP